MKSNKTHFSSESAPRAALKIGDVSQLSGIGIEALRFYERSGLLEKPSRSIGGYRIYNEGILQRLEFIKKAQTLGFSLSEIKQIIEDAKVGTSPCADVREIVRQRLAELDERMREMKRYRQELAETLREWDAVGRAPGHICGLIEEAEIKHPLSAPHKIMPPTKRENKLKKKD